MLSQSPSEANTSAEFLKSFIEFVEEVPDDISKMLSIIRELDILATNIVNEVEEISEQVTKSSTDESRKELIARLKKIIIQHQNIQTEKMHYSHKIQERVEEKSRIAEAAFQNYITTKTEEIAATSTVTNASIVQQVLSHLPLNNTSKPGSNASSSTNHSENNNGNGNERGVSKRLRRTRMDTELERAETPKPVKVESTATVVKEKPIIVQQQPPANIKKNTPASTPTGSNNNNNNGNNGKKKMTKKKKVSSASSGKLSGSQSVPDEATVDDENDDEETYCLCGQVSYGEMILCENDACKIEWFHFSCVSISSKPKGKWYCPNCRGDRPNILNKTLRKKYDII